MKCPFWRRRFTDALDTVQQVVVWALRTRHKSLPLPASLTAPATGHSEVAQDVAPDGIDKSVQRRRKWCNLPMDERVRIIRDDFVRRQYYVTGRLSTALYRDDCLFDGPDPDGRVRGVRKFCDAAAGLFDVRLSRVDLIDIYVDPRGQQTSASSAADVVVAEWRLEGALKLPWRPLIKAYTGSTEYSFDAEGLVHTHVETWSISVIDAFVSVVWKGFGNNEAPPIRELRERKLRQGTLQCNALLEVD